MKSSVCRLVLDALRRARRPAPHNRLLVIGWVKLAMCLFFPSASRVLGQELVNRALVAGVAPVLGDAQGYSAHTWDGVCLCKRLKGALIPIVALIRCFPLAPFGWSGTRRLFHDG
jgi:hypothetical protein